MSLVAMIGTVSSKLHQNRRRNISAWSPCPPCPPWPPCPSWAACIVIGAQVTVPPRTLESTPLYPPGVVGSSVHDATNPTRAPPAAAPPPLLATRAATHERNVRPRPGRLRSRRSGAIIY